MKILCYITVFSIIGTALRMGLEYISNFPLSPVTHSAIPQILGCFVFGLTVDDDLLLSKGLQVGLAGSLTTFSGWVFSVFTDFINFFSVNRSVAESIYAGFLNILVIMALAFSSLFFGMYSSNDRFRRLISISDTFFSNTTIMVIVSGALWILSLLLSILFNPIYYALVLAPIGTICRYFISIKLNTLMEKIPLGTFLCNMIGTIILATSLIISYYSRDSCVPIRAIIVGFCGNLTTLSSFINELFVRDHPYFYFLLSLFSGVFVMLIIDGTFLLVLRINSFDLDCF